MTGPRTTAGDLLARFAPLLLLVVVVAAFGAASPGFRTLANARNILVQSSSVAIVGVGMTFVLIAGGIDLSVGAIMFLAATISGRLVLGGWLPGVGPIPAWSAILLILPLGLLIGAMNALLIAGARLTPFVVTLAMLFIGRGLALQVTETRALNLPPAFLAFGQSSWHGISPPILLLVGTVAIGHLTLAHTRHGLHLHALGDNPEAARIAGLPTARLRGSVYVVSGLCAALGGIVSVAQLGAVSPTFGNQREFAAIAAAVLGGTSLTGGRGRVFPGTLLGAVLIQTVETGLNVVNADPYNYPVVLGVIIFVAVLIDRRRSHGTMGQNSGPGHRA